MMRKPALDHGSGSSKRTTHRHCTRVMPTANRSAVERYSGTVDATRNHWMTRAMRMIT
jgi:hypothetical protein